MTPNLTFNYGARTCLPRAHGGRHLHVSKHGSASCSAGGPIGVYETALAPDKGKGIIDWDWNNFGLNVGLTWDPFGDGKMSVSANFHFV
jgi:hypothetical protein